VIAGAARLDCQRHTPKAIAVSTRRGITQDATFFSI
jgi:hypothetical protein